MRVTLARPFDGHPAKETVDLPQAVARTLIRDGHARPASSATAPAGPASGEPLPAEARPAADAEDAGLPLTTQAIPLTQPTDESTEEQQ